MDTKVTHILSPLPTTRQELLSRLKNRQRSIIEHVQDVFLDLYDVPKFRNYLEATEDQHSVEGLVRLDEACAVNMIRERALKTQNPYLQDQKLRPLLLAMRAVQRRLQVGREQRVKEAQGHLFAPGGEEQ